MDYKLLNGLTLAYIGDSVYEIYNNTIRLLNEENNAKINNKSLAKIKFKMAKID